MCMCVSRSCTCSSGYDSPNCGTDVDECSSAPCANSGACTEAVGSYACTCAVGWMGDTCDQAMAAAFVISGATDSSYNGLYFNTAHVCSGKPVYQKGGSNGYVRVFFQSNGHSYWEVSDSGSGTSCVASGYLYSNGNGAVCPASPDGAGCTGKWQESVGSGYVLNPSLAVDATRACVGSPCGSRSTSCVGTDHICTCAVGWMGATCDRVDGFNISGATSSITTACTSRPRTSATASRSTRWTRANIRPSSSMDDGRIV